jgi:hypothetical protein
VHIGVLNKNKEQKKKRKKRNNKFPDPLFQVWLLALQKRLATPLDTNMIFYVFAIEIEIEISLLTKSGPQEGIYK